MDIPEDVAERRRKVRLAAADWIEKQCQELQDRLFPWTSRSLLTGRDLIRELRSYDY